jgi:hypothetical protein
MVQRDLNSEIYVLAAVERTNFKQWLQPGGQLVEGKRDNSQVAERSKIVPMGGTSHQTEGRNSLSWRKCV